MISSRKLKKVSRRSVAQRHTAQNTLLSLGSFLGNYQSVSPKYKQRIKLLHILKQNDEKCWCELNTHFRFGALFNINTLFFGSKVCTGSPTLLHPIYFAHLTHPAAQSQHHSMLLNTQSVCTFNVTNLSWQQESCFLIHMAWH